CLMQFVLSTSSSQSVPVLCRTLFCSRTSLPPTSALFPYTTLFRSVFLVMMLGAAEAHQDRTPRPSLVMEPFRGGKQRLRALMIRSEEHTSELQSRENLVCRLLLEKKKTLRRTLIDLNCTLT